MCSTYKVALAAAVALFVSATTSASADLQNNASLEVDTVVTGELVENLAFLRDNESLVVVGSSNVWAFRTFPTFDMSSIALDPLGLRATSAFVDTNDHLYVTGTSSPLEQQGRVLVLDAPEMAILDDLTIERPFSNPFVFVAKSGRVVISDLASGTVSVFDNREEIKKSEPKTRRAPRVVNLFCGPALQASWLEGAEGEEGAVIASPFGGATLEIAELRSRYYKCEPTLDDRLWVPAGSVATTVSHTVVRSGELVFAVSVARDRLSVLGRDGKTIVSSETGLLLNRFEVGKPMVKGDVHVVADDAGDVIVVASPRVARVSVFRYGEGKIQRVGTGMIEHTVDAAAISPDGAVVAVGGSKDGQGVITLLRNPLALEDGEVDYRRPFRNRWAQHALEAQSYDPGEVDGIIGRRTTAAIEGFQKANGIVVDGRLNQETLKLLYDTEARAQSEQ